MRFGGICACWGWMEQWLSLCQLAPLLINRTMPLNEFAGGVFPAHLNFSVVESSRSLLPVLEFIPEGFSAEVLTSQWE